jgi:hypothetical protein
MIAPLLLALTAATLIAPIPAEKQERDPDRAELVADEVASTARAFCAALRGLDDTALLGQLAPGFTARGLGPDPLDGKGLAAALRSRYAGASILRRCSFKPFEFTTDAAHAEAVAGLWLNLGGTLAGGERFGDLGDVRARLVRHQGHLRFLALELLPRTLTPGGGLRFTDVAMEIGLDPNFTEREEQLTQLLGALDNGGLAVADVDGDGTLDIYVVRSGSSLLYRGDGHGHFTEGAHSAGIAGPPNARAAIFVDLDNDGDLDLFVTNKAGPGEHAGNRLYRNDGHGHFTDVTRGSGAGQVGPYMSVVAADVDGDGRIDLYVAAYQDRHVHPRPSVLGAHNGRPNLLLHNLGGMHFRDVAREAGVAGSEWTLAAALADLDGDHRPELVVVNDYGSPQLYRNDSTPGTVRFTDVTAASGISDTGNGMGVDIGDVDGDGRPDIHLSKMYSTAGNRLLSQAIGGDPEWLGLAGQAARGNSLFHNDGKLHFTEVGAEAGIRRAGWAWSCQLADVDNDGDLDLDVANGFHTGQREDEL